MQPMDTIAYIKGELDELERGEFFRLKKVQGNKKKHAQKSAELRAAEGRESPSIGGSQASASVSSMVDGRDPDVIF